MEIAGKHALTTDQSAASTHQGSGSRQQHGNDKIRIHKIKWEIRHTLAAIQVLKYQPD